MSENAKRVTMRTLRQRAHRGEPIPMLTCYDASSARWLSRGGIDTFLVGDTAAQMILGHDTTLPVEMPFMLQITAAVRRGAPNAFIMADMPFGSFHGSPDDAMNHAASFLKVGGADCVKMECDASYAPLVERMSAAGIPVVAHLGARPQMVFAEGGYRRLGKTKIEANQLVDTAELMIQRGAAMLLLEAVTDEVSQRVVAIANDPPNATHGHAGGSVSGNTGGNTGGIVGGVGGNVGGGVPVIGCGSGSACHGQVLVLHDVMGLSDWQPPFAQSLGNLGQQMQELASQWADQVRDAAAAKSL